MVTVQEKIQSIEKERKEALLRGFKYILVMGLISLIPIFFSWELFIIFIFLFAVGTVFVIYRIWAPARIFGYFVKETYCLLITEGGAYKRAALQLKGYTLTEKGWIVPENEKDGTGVLSKYNVESGKRIEKRHNFFGMRFFECLGIFEEPLIDTFSWSKHDSNSQKIIGKEDVIYDGWIVVPYNYGIEVRNILTKDGMPVGFDLTLLSELLNPVIAKFGTKNWYNSFVQDITKTIVEAIGESTYDDIQNQSKDFGAYFFKKFEEPTLKEETSDKKMSLIERCLIKYGAHIMSIQVVKFIAPPDIVNAADEQKKEELMKKAAKTKASAVQEVVLTKAAAIDELFIKRSGLSPEDYAQEVLNQEDFEEKYGELYEACRKDVLDIMAIDKGTGVRINGGGGIVDAAAVFQILSGSKPSSEEPKEKKESEKEAKDKEKLRKLHFTEEEIKKYY